MYDIGIGIECGRYICNFIFYSYEKLKQIQKRRLDCQLVERCTDLQLRLYRDYYLCTAMLCIPEKICLSPDKYVV